MKFVLTLIITSEYILNQKRFNPFWFQDYHQRKMCSILFKPEKDFFTMMKSNEPKLLVHTVWSIQNLWLQTKVFRHKRNPASKFINDEYVLLSKEHYLEMLDQMQSVVIEHIKMKDMVGCSNHWSFHNTFHYTLTLTTTVGSTIVPSTSEGIVLPSIF